MEQSDNDEVGAASLSPKRVNSREKSVGYHIKTSIPDLDLRSVISTLEKTEANLEKNGCSSLLVVGRAVMDPDDAHFSAAELVSSLGYGGLNMVRDHVLDIRLDRRDRLLSDIRTKSSLGGSLLRELPGAILKWLGLRDEESSGSPRCAKRSRVSQRPPQRLARGDDVPGAAAGVEDPQSETFEYFEVDEVPSKEDNYSRQAASQVKIVRHEALDEEGDYVDVIAMPRCDESGNPTQEPYVLVDQMREFGETTTICNCEDSRASLANSCCHTSFAKSFDLGRLPAPPSIRDTYQVVLQVSSIKVESFVHCADSGTPSDGAIIVVSKSSVRCNSCFSSKKKDPAAHSSSHCPHIRHVLDVADRLDGQLVPEGDAYSQRIAELLNSEADACPSPEYGTDGWQYRSLSKSHEDHNAQVTGKAPIPVQRALSDIDTSKTHMGGGGDPECAEGARFEGMLHLYPPLPLEPGANGPTCSYFDDGVRQPTTHT